VARCRDAIEIKPDFVDARSMIATILGYVLPSCLPHAPHGDFKRPWWNAWPCNFDEPAHDSSGLCPM
jgi:hypothetical protein